MTHYSRRSFLGTTALAASVIALPSSLRAASPLRGGDLSRLDAMSQAALVASGEMTPLALVDAAIRRIETLNPKLNAIASPAFDRARGLAAGPLSDGPFRGVPFLIKDLMEYPPLPYMAGSRLLAQNIGDFRSPYADRIDAAGLVVLGTTTTPEFGLVPTTEPMLTGATRNPWDPTRSSGGSSGGAAVAVASGMVPVAHASDGGGSIRFPAACCGVFGLKPSRDRNPRSRREESPIGVENCFSRSVRDSALYLSLTERQDAQAPYAPIGFIEGASGRKLKIALILESLTGAGPEPETADAVRASAALCEKMGHEVSEVNWPFDGAAFVDHFMTVWGAGARGIVSMATKALGHAPDESVLEPWTLGLARRYGGRGAEGMQAAFANFAAVATRMRTLFSTYDVLLTPATPEPAPKLGYMGPDVAFDTLHDRIIAFAGYTPWQNATGSPAMSVPLAQSAAGLPIGIQFSAAPGGEATLIDLAYALEDANPWASRWPRISAVYQ